MRRLVLPFLTVLLTVSSTASDLCPIPGVRIDRSGTTSVHVRVEPVVDRVDTVESDGHLAVQPRIAGAIPTPTSDGGVAWVMRIDLRTAAAGHSTVQRVTTAGEGFDLPLARPAEGLVGAPAPGTIADLSYSGIRGGEHRSILTVEVARTVDGSSIVRRYIDIVVVFDTTAGAWALPLPKGGDVVQGGDAERFSSMLFIPVERTAIHRVTADELRRAGVPTDAAAARSIRVFGNGGQPLAEAVAAAATDASLHEQPIIVRTNADGSVRDVVFFAQGPTGWRRTARGIEHYVHPYDRRSGYLLSWGGPDGIRAMARPIPATAPATQPTTVAGRVFQEEDLVNAFAEGSGRRWFGRSIENGGSVSITTPLPGFVRRDTVRYVVGAAHKGTSSGTVTVSEQGTTMLQLPLTAVTKYMDSYCQLGTGRLPASMLGADGRSVLRIGYNGPDRTATGMIDYVAITYPRELMADANTFTFWSDPGLDGVVEWMVNGFSGDLFGFDITDAARPVLLTSTSVTGGLYGLRDSLQSGQPRQYLVGGVAVDARLESMPWLNLRTDLRRADAIVITHPSLLGSATAFKEYRESQGEMSVTVVTTDQIFREFSYGIQDPTAIRDFLYHCYTSWPTPPRYVLLWGDGHFDYRSISTAVPNMVLPYESDDPYGLTDGIASYTTDDYFVRLVGEDQFPEIGIGRLPITTDDDGRAIVNKIRAYETASATDDWRTRALLIADDSMGDPRDDPDGSTHLDQSERLDKLAIPGDVQSRKLYLVEYPTESVPGGRRKPTVTDDLLSTVNTSGSVLVNWIGHGNPRVWAHEQIFTRETTIPMMTNRQKPFFLTAATCDFARFDMTNIQSGAEELVMSQTGGAIGVFSASRVVYSYANEIISRQFYQQLFRRESDGRFPRLGDVMLRTKSVLSGTNDQKFFLLGDPTMRLLLPDHTVRFDAVNGTTFADTTDSVALRALEKVTVTGHIPVMQGDAVDTAFSGTATISLYDSDVTLTVLDTDPARTPNAIRRLGAALARTSARVDRGRFTAEFVIPKDIAFATLPGRLFGYATSTDYRFASGVTDRVFVNGIADVSYDDDEGPAMTIRMDSPWFRPGDIVRSNPILMVDLEDATGINATGIGIGHDLEASFDDGALIENLTASFATSVENPRAGSARRQIFGLAPGLHQVRVRSWDVLNNVAEAVTSFRIIGSSDGPVATELQAYPNPFQDRTTITFKHSIDRPFTATLRIFSTDGRMVYEQALDVSDMQTAPIAWDGRDASGFSLSAGVYHCVVQCVTADGATTNVGGKVTYVR